MQVRENGQVVTVSASNPQEEESKTDPCQESEVRERAYLFQSAAQKTNELARVKQRLRNVTIQRDLERLQAHKTAEELEASQQLNRSLYGTIDELIDQLVSVKFAYAQLSHDLEDARHHHTSKCTTTAREEADSGEDREDDLTVR